MAGLLLGTVLPLSPSANAANLGAIAPMALRMWWAEELTPTVMEDSEGVLLVPVSAYRATGLDNASKSGTLPKDVSAPAPPNTAADQGADRPSDPPRATPQDQPQEVVAPYAIVEAWATVYDQATLNMWNDTGYVPAFLDGVVVPETPDVSEAVFDLDIVTPNAYGEVYHLKLRVRRSDGAAAVVFVTPVGITVPEGVAERCDAGPYWPVCCYIGRDICIIVKQVLGPLLGPLVCGDCYACSLRCRQCRPSNPCHACRPCDLFDILCYVVPRAGCK